jgi:ribosome-binding protein aMBF1 (putative translation factor)
MKNTIITDEMYSEFIKKAIETEGWKVADTANKMALEIKAITLDQYRAAAQLIVKAYLAQ